MNSYLSRSVLRFPSKPYVGVAQFHIFGAKIFTGIIFKLVAVISLFLASTFVAMDQSSAWKIIGDYKIIQNETELLGEYYCFTRFNSEGKTFSVASSSEGTKFIFAVSDIWWSLDSSGITFIELTLDGQEPWRFSTVGYYYGDDQDSAELAWITENGIMVQSSSIKFARELVQSSKISIGFLGRDFTVVDYQHPPREIFEEVQQCQNELATNTRSGATTESSEVKAAFSPSLDNTRWVYSDLITSSPEMKVLAGYTYVSSGLLAGEGVIASIVEDQRHFEKTGVKDHALVVTAQFDIAGTYPDQQYGHPSAWGICYEVNDDCTEFELLTEDFEGQFQTEAFLPTWRGNLLSLVANCYPSIGDINPKGEENYCDGYNMGALVSVGVIHLDRYESALKSSLPGKRKLALRLYDSDGEKTYLKLTTDELNREIERFLVAR